MNWRNLKLYILYLQHIVSIEDQDKFTERLEKFILTQEDRETRR